MNGVIKLMLGWTHQCGQGWPCTATAPRSFVVHPTLVVHITIPQQILASKCFIVLVIGIHLCWNCNQVVHFKINPKGISTTQYECIQVVFLVNYTKALFISNKNIEGVKFFLWSKDLIWKYHLWTSYYSISRDNRKGAVAESCGQTVLSSGAWCQGSSDPTVVYLPVCR